MIDYEILQDIITANELCKTQRNELAKAVELLKADRLIELPCAVGDTVYLVYETDEFENVYKEIDIGEVFAIGIDENLVIWISVRYESGLKYCHPLDTIGKTVFLTPEEAEAKLAEMEGE